MKIYNSLEEYRPHEDGAYVALGFFDGVHLGHRAVIGSCADESGALPCTVLTFGESPAKAQGRQTPPLLCGNARKTELLAEAGADEVIFADFAAVKDMSPEDFVQQILCDRLRAKRVYCGFNYRFGRGASGDIRTLQTLCAGRGIGVSIHEPVTVGGEQVSSSLIRGLIADGSIERANMLLGYRYAVAGDIGSGNHIGSAMGFPTVNMPVGEGLAVPGYGVYASDVIIDGIRHKGATNIGVHPTVGESGEPLCETFLIDFEGGELYGRHAVCELTAFIRPEKRFDSIGELSEQIKKDCETIARLTRENGERI